MAAEAEAVSGYLESVESVEIEIADEWKGALYVH